MTDSSAGFSSVRGRYARKLQNLQFIEIIKEKIFFAGVAFTPVFLPAAKVGKNYPTPLENG